VDVGHEDDDDEARIGRMRYIRARNGSGLGITDWCYKYVLAMAV
jgi:hypothetical protein